MTDDQLDPELRDLAKKVRGASLECYSPDERDALIRQALLASTDQRLATTAQRRTRRSRGLFGSRVGSLTHGEGSYLRSRVTGGAIALALTLALFAPEWGVLFRLRQEQALIARAPTGFEPTVEREAPQPEADVARVDPSPGAAAQRDVVERTIHASEQEEVTLRRAGRLLLSPGTRLRIRETIQWVAVELEEGALLLDIERQSDFPTVSVGVADSRFWVDGTIFSVEAAAENYRVEVFEGRVRLETPTTTTPLAQGTIHTRGVMPHALPTGLRARAESSARARRLGDTKGQVRPAATRQAVDAIRLGEAQEALRKGDFDGALSMSERQLEHSTDPSWLLLAGDAARAARKTHLAIDYYRRLSELPGAGTRRSQGAYLAARLEAENGNHAVAWSLLQNSGATGPGSPLAETASMLSIALSKAMEELEQLEAECERFAATFDEDLPGECGPTRPRNLRLKRSKSTH